MGAADGGGGGGSGPGGASAARELVRAGKKVIMLEWGSRARWLGSHLAVLPHVDFRNALPVGHEIMVRGLTVGGSSLIFCGTAARPAAFIKEQTGIDLLPYAEAFEQELGIAPLPDHLVGEAARRMMEAAQALGLDWQLLPKFIDAQQCERDCGACMLGCPTKAKWTAARFVDEACEMGMELRTRACVEQVLHEGGTVTGVRGRGSLGPFTVRAEQVLLAAGGLGTPVILKRSGIDEAGQGFFSDPLVFTYGVLDEPIKGSIYDVPMTAGTWQFHDDDGYLMTDLGEPWILQLASMMLSRPPRPDQAANLRRTMGIMTKCKDPISGTIDRRGRLRKAMEPEVERRLQAGDAMAREILRKAGVRQRSLVTSPVKAAHPGGSAPIGRVVDAQLQTSIKNCFAADASVVPDELGTPVVLLAMCLGQYAAEQMLAS